MNLSSLPPAVIPPDGDFLPALVGTEKPGRSRLAVPLQFPTLPQTTWPRSSYLLPVCLGAASRRVLQLGQPPRRHHVMAVTESCATPAGPRRPSTPIFRRTRRGGEERCWMLKLMDVESFQHIRRYGNLRAPPAAAAGPCRRREIRALFVPAEADDPSIGVRDAAMLVRHSRLTACAGPGSRAGFAATLLAR